MKRILQVLSVFTAICIAGISASYAFELNGFADVSFTKSTEGENRADDEYRNGDFAFGTLDLYLGQTLDDIDILVELIVEKGNVLDLERLTLGYTFSDTVKLRAGRFHTPLGFWNNAYHHGVQLQPTIQRPDFLKFEDDGGIIPTHVVGASVSGRIDSGAGAVEYTAMVGNGPQIVVEDAETSFYVLSPNNISDNNIGKAVAFSAAMSPSFVSGLKLGVSGHISEIQSDVGVPTVFVDQSIYAFAATYAIGPVGLAAEYFTINNKDDESGDDYTNNAYYGLITYTLMEKWVPYVMYENLSVKKDDPYMEVLEIGRDTEELTVGLRYNINYRSSVKVEFRDIINERNVVEEKDANWNEYAVQWALAF